MASTLKLSDQARKARSERDPFRKPVRAATAPRVHTGQGPKTPMGDGNPGAPKPRVPVANPSGTGSPPRPASPRSKAPMGQRPMAEKAAPRRTIPSAGPVAPLGEERLAKRMGMLGLASRREADAWIEAGWVRVDGRVATLGDKVGPNVRIDIDARAKQRQAERVTILVNKPLNVVSGQAEDGHVPAVTLVRRDSRWAGCRVERGFDARQLTGMAPAGRLDLDSTGLLVLTQDGRVARTLIGEDSQVEKEYLVHVDWRDPWAWSDAALERLRHGLVLDDQALKPAQVERVLSPTSDEIQTGVLRFVLTEGRKRQIRRMAELVGLRVTALQRVRIGRVALGELPLGEWRYLRGDESF